MEGDKLDEVLEELVREAEDATKKLENAGKDAPASPPPPPTK